MQERAEAGDENGNQVTGRLSSPGFKFSHNQSSESRLGLPSARAPYCSRGQTSSAPASPRAIEFLLVSEASPITSAHFCISSRMFVKLQTEKKKKKTLTLIKNQIRCDSEERIKDNWILFRKDKINWLLQQNKPEPLPRTSP